jgi:hypothetical protein
MSSQNQNYNLVTLNDCLVQDSRASCVSRCGQENRPLIIAPNL